jgi:predicted RNA-binding Zn-ribbon protein involved in translation (DUF1610 family)
MTAGLSTRFKVQGDFDVVCSFELLHVEKPDKGFGSGATLYAAVNPNAGIAVSMARRVMPDGKNVILAVHQQNINDAKKTTSKSAPAASSTGKMRLQRTGAKVRFLYADGDALEFKELSVVDFSADDIAYVQIGAHNWGGESAVDVRFLDFDLRAERLPGLPNDGLPEPAAAVAQPLEPPTENSIWLIVTGGIVLGIGLIGGAALLAFLFWRRRSQPSQAALTSSGNEKAKITFDCLACGKTIRIKAEQRDKKFKCPHCGEVAARPRKIVDLT